jgi:hypothetical protein
MTTTNVLLTAVPIPVMIPDCESTGYELIDQSMYQYESLIEINTPAKFDTRPSNK